MKFFTVQPSPVNAMRLYVKLFFVNNSNRLSRPASRGQLNKQKRNSNVEDVIIDCNHPSLINQWWFNWINVWVRSFQRQSFQKKKSARVPSCSFFSPPYLCEDGACVWPTIDHLATARAVRVDECEEKSCDLYKQPALPRGPIANTLDCSRPIKNSIHLKAFFTAFCRIKPKIQLLFVFLEKLCSEFQEIRRNLNLKTLRQWFQSQNIPFPEFLRDNRIVDVTWPLSPPPPSKKEIKIKSGQGSNKYSSIRNADELSLSVDRLSRQDC